MTNRNEGYIKLYRSLLDWEWFHDVNVRLVFVYMLLAANYRPKAVRATLVGRGQFLTSYAKIAQKNGLTVSQVRTAVSKLRLTGEVATCFKGGGLLVSVINYEKYQGAARADDRGNRRADDSEIAGMTAGSPQQHKKDKNLRNIDDDEGGEIYDARAHFELCFGYALNPAQGGRMDGLLKMYEMEDVFEAIEETARRDVRNPLAYMTQLLRDWSLRKEEGEENS